MEFNLETLYYTIIQGPYIVLLLYPLSILLLGYLIIKIIRPEQIKFNVGELMAISFGIGIGAMGLILLIILFFFYPFNFLKLGISLLIVFGIYTWRNYRGIIDFSRDLIKLFKRVTYQIKKSFSRPNKRDFLKDNIKKIKKKTSTKKILWRILQLIICSFFIYILLWNFLIAFLGAYSSPFMEADTFTVWTYRAKLIYHYQKFDLSFLTKYEIYPPLVSIIEAYGLFLLNNGLDDRILIIFPTFALMSIIFIISSLRRFNVNWIICLFCATLLITHPAFFYWSRIAYADIPLGFFTLLSSILLIYYMESKNNFYLLLSSIFIGLSLWIKVEGIATLIVNSGIFGLYLLKEYPIKKKWGKKLSYFGFYVGLAIGLYLPWYLVITYAPIGTYEGYSGTSLPATSVDFYSRLTIILSYFIEYLFFGTRNNFIIWSIFFGLSIICFFRLKNWNFFLFFLMIFGHFAVYVGVYLTTQLRLSHHLTTSFGRMLLHFLAVSCFYDGIVLENLFKDKNKMQLTYFNYKEIDNLK